MPKCQNCGNLMVRADMYDPEGVVPLTIVTIEEKPWACISSVCKDSSQNQPERRSVMLKIFIEDGFPFEKEPVWLDDKSYSDAISSLVFVCTDTVVICEGKIFLAKRRNEPMADWWVIGGRMKFGEMPDASATRCFKRETKLAIPPHRFEQFGIYMVFWKTRAQEPRNAGTHSLNILFALELTEEELKSICLDEKEYTKETLLLYPNQLNKLIKEEKIHRYFGAVLTDLINQNII